MDKDGQGELAGAAVSPCKTVVSRHQYWIAKKKKKSYCRNLTKPTRVPFALSFTHLEVVKEAGRRHGATRAMVVARWLAVSHQPVEKAI